MSIAAPVSIPTSPSTSALLARQPSTVAPSVGVSPLGYSPFGSSCRLSVESFQRQSGISDSDTSSAASPTNRWTRSETWENGGDVQGNGSGTRRSLGWSQDPSHAACNDRFPRHVSFALENEVRDLGSLDDSTPSDDSSLDKTLILLRSDLKTNEHFSGIFPTNQCPSVSAAIASCVAAVPPALTSQHESGISDASFSRQVGVGVEATSPARQHRTSQERTGPYEGLELVIPKRKPAPPPPPPPPGPVPAYAAPQSSHFTASAALSDKVEFVTPWNLSRWIILLACLVITVTTGSFFFNWPTTQMMILKSNAYSWLCVEGDEELFRSHGGIGEGILPPNANPPLTITPSNSEAAYIHLPNDISQNPNDLQAGGYLSQYPLVNDIMGITTSAGAFPVMRRAHAMDVSSWPVLAAQTGLARRLIEIPNSLAMAGALQSPLLDATSAPRAGLAFAKLGSKAPLNLDPLGEATSDARNAMNQQRTAYEFVRKADLIPPPAVGISLIADDSKPRTLRPYRLPLFRRLGVSHLEGSAPIGHSGGVVWGLPEKPKDMRKEEDISVKRQLLTEPHPCIEQIQTINSLMPVGVASWFFFSFIGGVMMDVLGPKLTSCSGLVLSSAGWTVLAFCSQKVPLYFLAFALIGCGVDVVFLGILNTANLFPNYRGTIVSVFNAARSLAFAIPAVVNALLRIMPFTVACILYATTLLGWIIVVSFLVPNQPYPNIQTIPSTPDNGKGSRKQPTRRTTLEQKSALSSMETELASSREDPSRETCERCSQKLGVGSTALESMTTVSSAPQQVGSLLSPHQTDEMQSFERQLLDDIALKDPSSSPMMNLPLVCPPTFCSDCAARETGSLLIQNEGPSTLFQTSVPSRWGARGMNQAQRVVRHARSLIFFPLIPMAMLTVLRGSFLSNSAMDQLGPFVHLFSILTPLSFLPAPLFGFLADKLSIHAVFVMLNTLGSLQFLLLVLAPDAAFCLASVAVLNLLVSAFFLGQFYCYVTLSFPSEVAGTLVGITISSAGLFGLFVTPMYNYSTNAKSFRLMNWMCLCMTLATYVCIWVLWKAKKKKET